MSLSFINNIGQEPQNRNDLNSSTISAGVCTWAISHFSSTYRSLGSWQARAFDDHHIKPSFFVSLCRPIGVIPSLAELAHACQCAIHVNYGVSRWDGMRCLTTLAGSSQDQKSPVGTNYFSKAPGFPSNGFLHLTDVIPGETKGLHRTIFLSNNRVILRTSSDTSPPERRRVN